jgi:hypothetical protein
MDCDSTAQHSTQHRNNTAQSDKAHPAFVSYSTTLINNWKVLNRSSSSMSYNLAKDTYMLADCLLNH